MRVTVLALALLAAAVPALAKPPTWDRKVDSRKRFKVLKAFESNAVLDQETGLVWAREANDAELAFTDANTVCNTLELGARGGWRLPTIQEIRTLFPPVTQVLPAGHPFTASDGLYWTATGVDDSVFTWVGDLGNPSVAINTADTTSDYAGAWCVRGGLGGSTD